MYRSDDDLHVGRTVMFDIAVLYLTVYEINISIVAFTFYEIVSNHDSPDLSTL